MPTQPAPYLQPAFVGGLVLGVLSALPLVNIANLCCCLWVIAGGAVAAYALQQRQDGAITPGDGALVGLLAGLIGTCIYLVLSIPITLFMAPFERQLMDRLASLGSMPPEFRDFANRQPGLRIFAILLDFVVRLFVDSLFSTIGGLLGAMVFGRRTPRPVIDIPSNPSVA